MRAEDYRLRDWNADVARGYLTVLDGVRLPIVPNPCLKGALQLAPDESTKYEISANSEEKWANVRKSNIRLDRDGVDPHHPVLLFRKRNYLTCAEAGRALGVDGNTVWQWEVCRTRTPADIHERIARAEEEME